MELERIDNFVIELDGSFTAKYKGNSIRVFYRCGINVDGLIINMIYRHPDGTLLEDYLQREVNKIDFEIKAKIKRGASIRLATMLSKYLIS